MHKIIKTLGIIAILILLSGVAQAEDWPMFHHDLMHTGYTNESVKPPLVLLWKYNTSESIFSSPAIADEMVYVSSINSSYSSAHTGCIYALDAKTGNLKWKYKTGAIDFSSPAVSNGIVYVGSSDSYVYALDSKTGDLKWKYKTDDLVWSSPAVSEGIVYICSDDNHVYALDAKNGDLKWKYETYHDRCTVSSPSVSDAIVYVRTCSYDDGGFYFSALDAKNGDLKWKYKTGYIEHSPAISGGLVYVCSLDGIIYAFANESAVLAASAARTAKIIGLSVGGIIALILVIIGVFKARRSEYEKKIKAYRDRYEQLKREGYKPDDELEEIFK